MRIICESMKEIATFVRRCDAHRTGNHGCYHCLMYPFCSEGDYEDRKQVEDFLELEAKKHAELEGTCHCRQ